jgi:protocatechuate 3,4-dioxygenase beta subunit
MTTLVRRLSTLVISCLCIGLPSIDSAAQGPPPGIPDPARFPSRPGMPEPGSPGRPPRDSSSRTPPPATGTGVIRGVVVAAETGHPLRRARVMLRAIGGGPGRQFATMTGADGAFALTTLPAGRYELRASKGRYVDTGYGARRPAQPGRPFELAEGQTMEDVSISLPTAGVITGRVVDDAGEPMAGVQVALRRVNVDGALRVVGFGPQRTTDDSGTFRLFGLMPGKYLVSATASDDSRFGGDVVEQEVTGFAPTYFPGTPLDTDAQPIEVTAGAEIVADIALVPARLATISGVVVDARGRLAKSGMVMVRSSASGFMGLRSGGPIRPDGMFRVNGVPPGEYRLNVMAGFDTTEFPRGDMNGPGSMDMPVTVSGSDIADLRIVVTDPLKIPGTVTFEGNPPTTGDRTVNVMAMSREAMGGGRSTQSREDGSFTLDVRPGPVSLMVRAPSGWMVKRLLYRGREIEDDVDFADGPPGRLDVILTNQLTVVTGSVTDGSSRPVLDYEVLLMPDTEGPTAMRRWRFARADPQGRFKIEGVRPGNYLAVAQSEMEREQLADPDALEALRTAGTRVRVGDGQTQSISLPLTTLP